MKIRLQVFVLMIAASFFVAAINAASAAAQDMPGMNMPMPKKSKPKSKSSAKTKPKARSKAKTVSKKSKPPAKLKSSLNTKRRSAPKAKPTQMLMDKYMQIDMPSNAPKPTRMPMDMNMPMPSPTVTPQPSPAPSPTQMPMDMPMATPTPSSRPTATAPAPTPKQPEMQMPEMQMPTPAPTPPPNTSPAGGGQTQTLPNLSKKFPPPVADNERYGSILFDVFEFRPGRGGDSDFRWDIEGWYGTDYNRFFIKSEGERNTAFKADYDIDLQLLYSRLISPYFNFQTGIRFETQTFRGANVTRPQAVVGFEGLAPYFIELESAAFVDPKGNVSGRLSLTKDFLLTNRLIMQARFETNMAIQRVERFTTGRGLNNIEAGFRFRYEFRRRFAPYVGVSFDRSFFGTADLVRQDGGDPKQIRLVTGVRMFF